MADRKLIVLLKKGVEVWNRWRKGNSTIRPNLRGADLRGKDLRGKDLRGADLSSADLRGAGLSSADLRGADLSRTDLRGKNLRGAILRDAILSSTDLSSTDLCGADLSRTDLSGKNLRGAILRGAILRDADLCGADLSSADLRSADLRSADLRGTNLRGTDLRGTNLSSTDLSDTNLSGTDLSNVSFYNANLCNADLRRATLIDSRLDRADLTGAKLWETQRGGWSIKDVICRQAFWDRDGKKPTEYRPGEFERIFAEKPRIVLRYPGGMSPVDLAMLPLIVERLQAERPGYKLHISSVQDDGGGATVTITVDDLADRSTETFATEVEALRRDFAAIQHRLHHEQRLRLTIETKYQAVFEDVLPRLLDRVLPKTEINVGQITGPTIIESTTMNTGDTYNIHGQTGAVGPKAHAHDMTFQQVQNQGALDLPRLAEELARLRAAMKQETEGTAEQDEAIGEVAKAEKAAGEGDDRTMLRHLKAAGTWTLGIAEKIGVPLAVEAMKRMM